MLVAKVLKDEKGNIVRCQSLKEHSMDVAKKAEASGMLTGFPALAKLTGIIHDMGKAKQSFQDYILHDAMPKGSVIHSRAGALWALKAACADENGNLHIPYAGDVKALKLTVQVISMAILGHHTGPQNIVDPMTYDFLQGEKAFADKEESEGLFDTFYQEVASKEMLCNLLDAAVMEVSAFLGTRVKEHTEKYEGDGQIGKRYRLSFRGLLSELIASYLVDADRLSSQEWATNTPHQYVPPKWDVLEDKLNQYIEGKKSDTVIGKMRRKLSDNLYEDGVKPQGIFKLWAPTGFGKTLGSIRYALRHAEMHGLSRVIYIIPYTSIIDQTAQEFRNIFGEDSVLEHHSNVYFADDEDGKEQLSRYEQAQQVWDKPIVVTTMVRFLEICFSMRNTELRRLSFLTNSVIVFDEIQTIPQRCVYPFYLAAEFLRDIGKSSLLLCSATIPAFENEPFKLKCDGMLGGLTDADELVLRRTDIKDISYIPDVDKNGEMWRKYTAKELVGTVLKNKGRTNLIIHNTKKAAEMTFEEIEKEAPADAKKFLLTTNLCSEHRRKLIEEIRACLQDDSAGEVYIVATQLIEAGVDISVDVVFRSYAGLDSIIQAAGRCNRNGNGDTRSPVYVFWSADENISSYGLRDIKISQDAYRSLVRSNYGKTDIQGTASIDMFYKNKSKNSSTEEKKYVYGDGNSIFKDFTETVNITSVKHLMLTTPFSRIGDNFRVIDDTEQVSVVVPFDEKSQKIIADLQNPSIDAAVLYAVLKKAQRYTVTLFKNQLNSSNNVYQVNGVYFAREYDPIFGLKPSVEGKACFI